LFSGPVAAEDDNEVTVDDQEGTPRGPTTATAVELSPRCYFQSVGEWHGFVDKLLAIAAILL